ncbi:Hypothetical protein FKW44_019093 [Caligus rogercresseyi]|uniref:Uncharacterized protein n=1 Tax=Caligus rogercresseyi TaxID=217165 RepID=A0A7T8GVE6_CALRO|nr:Hypothetical protein FKW44_019093 [Caligus rogercresseyi]
MGCFDSKRHIQLFKTITTLLDEINFRLRKRIPEDVSFSASKTKALDALKAAEAVVKKEKDRIKEIRRKKHQFFKDQKEASQKKKNLLDEGGGGGTQNEEDIFDEPLNKVTRLDDPEGPTLITDSTEFHVSSSRDLNRLKTLAPASALMFKRNKMFSSKIQRQSIKDKRRGLIKLRAKAKANI